jgi:ATP-dependent protease HslVU (ClpYQ) peptidase subunit
MTAIVGIQGKDWAVLASDSMVSYDDRSFTAKGMDKVIVRGEYAWAVAGDALAGDITTHWWKPPKVSKTLSPDDFFMTKVIPSLRNCLTDNGYVPDKEDKDAGFDALIVINGIIYQTETTYGWMRDDRGLYAIGSGGKTALGVLAAFEANQFDARTAEAAARKAIEISTEYNIYVGGEVQITTQTRK